VQLQTAGESHGKALLALLTRVPSGIVIDTALIQNDLKARRVAEGRSERQRKESDQFEILSGVWKGQTTGAPVAIQIVNTVRDGGEGDGDLRDVESAVPVTVPRPNHADLPGAQKYGWEGSVDATLCDMRAVSERASARETAARVAAGAVAKMLLDYFDVSFLATTAHKQNRSDRVTWEEAAQVGDTLGGCVQVEVYGLVPGLGSCMEAVRRLDARLGAALFSIPAVKAVSFGDGQLLSAERGSRVADPILLDPDTGRLRRAASHSGGIDGGMTTGETLCAQLGVKPVPTLGPGDSAPASLDLRTGKATVAPSPRHDTQVAAAVAVIAVAEIALTLSEAYQEKFGGDVVSDMREAWSAYRQRIRG
jgi:chorismate synthase